MRYKDRDELVRGLRELADFVETYGHEIPGDLKMNSAYNFLYDDYGEGGRTAKEKARIVAKVLAKGGKAEKNFQGNYLELVRKFGPLKIEFNINRDMVCEKRVVEVIHHEEKTIPAYDEEVVEWDCIDPLLKAS